MKYQDIWNGGLIEKGLRECESRYQIIKTFCETLKEPFTVCDIGANMNYFGIRLTEDFNCKVMSFEFHQFDTRKKLVKNNKNILFLERKISLNDLELLNSCSHFNLVLALSVLHHLPGDSSKWIDQFKILGDNVIMEFAGDDSKRTLIRRNYKVPENSKILGYGNSHLKQFKRPIILL